MPGGERKRLLQAALDHRDTWVNQLPLLKGTAGRPMLARCEGLTLEVLADTGDGGQTIHLGVTRVLPGGSLRMTVEGELESGRLMLIRGWATPSNDPEDDKAVTFVVIQPCLVPR